MRRPLGAPSALVVVAALLIVAPAPASSAPAPALDLGPEGAIVDPPAPDADGEVPVLDEDEVRRREALAAFQRANHHFLAGEYAEAAREFRLSYETVPSLEALVAAALAFERAGLLIAAALTYREYLDFEDDDGRRREEALAAYQQLRARIGELQLRVDNPAAVAGVSLNGEALALDDFPRIVMPGVVSLQIIGAAGNTRTIDAEVRPGGTTLINIPDLALISRPKVEPKRPEVALEPPAPDRGPGVRIAFLSGVGVTGAAVLAAATLGGLTLAARSDYEDGLCSPPEGGACAAGSTYPLAAEQRFHRLASATNAMIGVSAGVAVITAALGIVHARRRAEARAKSKTGRTRINARIRGGGGAVVIIF